MTDGACAEEKWFDNERRMPGPYSVSLTGVLDHFRGMRIYIAILGATGTRDIPRWINRGGFNIICVVRSVNN